MIDPKFVSIDISSDDTYPKEPFNPTCIYDEFKNTGIIKHVQEDNNIYNKVRTVLQNLKLDSPNIGTPQWNPFSEFIKPGNTIVIKPNLVYDEHPLNITGNLCTITHASVIRPIIDYALLATHNNCKIIICDAPLQNANWDRLTSISGLNALREYYGNLGITIDLYDLRREISYKTNGMISSRVLNCRPLEFVAVDLGNKSELMPIIKYNKKFEITNYHGRDISVHHNRKINEYCIPKLILTADVFINVPKMKTHKKAGISCAMKNIVGINADKTWIAHHRRGSRLFGGDEYSKFNLKTRMIWHTWNLLKKYKILSPIAPVIKNTYQRIALRGNTLEESRMVGKEEIMEGSWYGNDTLWRCILDLNKILLYADKNGSMRKEPQRNYFCLVDGIISAEGEGPMYGTPKKTGIILAGFNPLAIDKVCADLMGFDYTCIPYIKYGFEVKYWLLANFRPIEIEQNTPTLTNFKFRPSLGWIGHITKK